MTHSKLTTAKRGVDPRGDAGPGHEPAGEWYVLDPDGFEVYDTEEEARSAAEEALDIYRDGAGDRGWPDDIACLQWGRLVPHQVARVVTRPAPEWSPFDEMWDVTLEDA